MDQLRDTSASERDFVLSLTIAQQPNVFLFMSQLTEVLKSSEVIGANICGFDAVFSALSRVCFATKIELQSTYKLCHQRLHANYRGSKQQYDKKRISG